MEDITTRYWKQTIEDYLSCGVGGEEDISLSEEQTQNIIKSLLNDDYVWGAIDEAIGFYVREEVGQ